METYTDVVSTATKRRRKPRVMTAGHLDGRTRAAKRARLIAAELEAGFGDEITENQRRRCSDAASFIVLAEDLVAYRFAGLPVLLDEVLRAEGVAKRKRREIIAEYPVKRAPSSDALDPDALLPRFEAHA